MSAGRTYSTPEERAKILNEILRGVESGKYDSRNAAAVAIAKKRKLKEGTVLSWVRNWSRSMKGAEEVVGEYAVEDGAFEVEEATGEEGYVEEYEGEDAESPEALDEGEDASDDVEATDLETALGRIRELDGDPAEQLLAMSERLTAEIKRAETAEADAAHYRDQLLSINSIAAQAARGVRG